MNSHSSAGQQGLFHWTDLTQWDEYKELQTLTKNYEAIAKAATPKQVGWVCLSWLEFLVCIYPCNSFVLLKIEIKTPGSDYFPFCRESLSNPHMLRSHQILEASRMFIPR